MKISQILLVVLLLCGVSASTTLAEHHGSTGDALLVIKRSPNFGTKQGCSISIDGVSYGIIGYNRRLETSVAPGEHVVTMQPVPNYRRPGLRNRQRVYVHAGRANVFTLSWGSADMPVLK
jgi:hypothetical protein